MRSDAHSLESLPWPEIQRALARDPRLLLAVGALEQSGPHLPLGANHHVASAVVDEASGRTGVLRAPPFAYGVRLPGSKAFPGTSGLGRKSLHRTVNELLAAWEDHGVQEFILVTAQRSEAHLEALLMALTSQSETTVFDLSAIHVEDLLEGDPALEHAGERETALLLHLMPHRVRVEAMEDVAPPPAVVASYRRGHPPTPPLATRGVSGYPTRATAEKGARIFQRYVQELVQVLSTEPDGLSQAPEPQDPQTQD